MTVMRDNAGALINVAAVRERFIRCVRTFGHDNRTTIYFESEQISVHWTSRADAERFLALLADETADEHPALLTPDLQPTDMASW